MIKIEGGKYILYSKDGSRKLGQFDSEEAAKAREAEILRIERAKEADGEISLDDKSSMVRRAYMDQVPMGMAPSTWVCEVFDDYLIAAQEGKYFRVNYSIDGEVISFGDPVEVRMEYVTVSEALEALAPKGKTWEVRLIREGVNKKNPAWIYTRKALETLLPFIPGAPLRAVEAMPGVFGHKGKAEKIGELANPTAQESDGFYEPRAEARIDESRREWLLGEMKARRVNGVSINAPIEAVTLPNGHIWVKKFLGLESLDLATTPAAGGAFLRATESVAEGDSMKVEDILALLKKHKREDLITKLGATPTLEQAQEALDEAMQLKVETKVKIEPKPQSEHLLSAQEAQEMRDLIAQAKLDSSDAYLTRKLADSNLPEPAKKKIDKQFRGKLFAREALDEALTAEKEMLDALGQSGQVAGAGATRIEMGQEAIDKIQIAMDRAFGVKVEGSPEIKAFRGLRDAYVQVTGDSLVSGQLPRRKMQSQEAIVSADFPFLLANTINRRVLQDYREVNYHIDRLISFQGSASDFKAQEASRVGYFSDLDDVDPEVADYQEAVKPGEEHITYSVGQKGNLLTISRKTIVNDDLSGITRRVRGWGRAAHRTLARFLWGFYLNNATYDGDATAWFAVGHGNLGTTALDAAELLVVVTALMDMTEPDSGEKLGLDEDMKRRMTLVVPHALWGTAAKINQAQYLDANFTPNPVYLLFGAQNERIVTLPLETDANNWGVLCDPNDRDILEVKFLNGQVEPEIFLADQPTVGQMFVADKLQYKIRHEYGADLLDFRNAYKEVVA